ncbi:unnamed protein product [Owenia fusiformis]|uniref:Uncharacterized protein n=1 Tax=Owenia fusiformis TaxID=6347 RepID=A0A8J1UGJ4_OWEFU|nr:unnamed protein product [Owenia fusiformis]
MKVTVCFGNVRVVVPCGNGDILVKDLIHKAVLRYRKATGKPNDYWINVANLKSISDSGILDPDDQLSDVADDREQLIALYEEQDAPPVPHNGGDGTSASSVGTASPDIFKVTVDDKKPGFQPVIHRQGRNDVVITPNDLTSGTNLPLVVRRGSEPNLTTVGKTSEVKVRDDTAPKPNSKRWSAIAAIDEDTPPTSATRRELDSDDGKEHSPNSPEWTKVNGTSTPGPEDKSAFSRFARDSTRQSTVSSEAMYRWLDTQDARDVNAQYSQQMGRREPLGGPATTTDEKQDTEQPENLFKNQSLVIVDLKNEGGPLGIHVVPDYDQNNRDTGLIIQGIEPGGRISRDARFQRNDKIVEINGKSLIGVDFTSAQEIFKNALQTNKTRLKLLKHTSGSPPKVPPPIKPKPSVKKQHNTPDVTSLGVNSHGVTSHNVTSLNKPNNLTSMEHKLNNLNKNNQHRPADLVLSETPTDSKLTNGSTSPSKKTPPAPPVRDPSTTLSSSAAIKPVIAAPTNTRKIGKKIYIQLTKGPQGLGFSITTRDNPAGGNCPIYIKNILPKGAAIDDGRLKSGDRLLEVNGIEMTGKSQAEAVSILRNTKLGSIVNLVVSRQEVPSAPNSPFIVPRELTSPTLQQAHERIDDTSFLSHKEVLTFNIPLNDTGSAGLGVSVKGKTQTTSLGTQDLGIFIKAVITGGAAYKDGRLHVNDQLIKVNGHSLLGRANTESMDFLRNAMQNEGPIPGVINLVVARRIGGGPITPTGPMRAPSEEVDAQIPEPQAPPKSPIDQIEKNFKNQDLNQIRNPVLDKLTGGLRNTSYNMATQDSLDQDSLNQSHQSTTPEVNRTRAINVTSTYNNKANTLSSPTLNSPPGDTVMIQDDTYPPQQTVAQNTRVRPASTLGLPNLVNRTDSSENGAPKPPTWLADQWDHKDLDESGSPLMPFDREGFGRQSMSEKRHANVDAKNIEFVQQLKYAKNNKTGERYPGANQPIEGTSAVMRLSESDVSRAMKRVGSAESLLVKAVNGDVGPTLGMKRSSSLESLQAMVQEVQLQEDDEPAVYKGPTRVIRGRGCNESFRAAVDRSYEAPLDTSTNSAMETLEEESSETASLNKSESTRSSFSGSEKEARKKKEKKKDAGLFKGLGHMFRFGKHRKSLEERSPRLSPQEMHLAEQDRQKQEQIEKYRARLAHQEEQDRIQEQYRKLQEKQRVEQQKLHPPGHPTHTHVPHTQPPPVPPHNQPNPQYQQPPLQYQTPPQQHNKQNYQPNQPTSRPQSQYQIPQSQYQSPQPQSQYHNPQPPQKSQFQPPQTQSHFQPPQSQSQLQSSQPQAYNYQRMPQQYQSHQSPAQSPQQRRAMKSPAQQQWGTPPRPQRQAASESDDIMHNPELAMNRTERIQQLRARHQQRHQARQGAYPGEDREERYEQQIQQMEHQPMPEQFSNYAIPPRQRQAPETQYPYDNRAYSRDPQTFSHYQNFDEIRQDLQRHDQYQEKYHIRGGADQRTHPNRELDTLGRDQGSHGGGDQYSFHQPRARSHTPQMGYSQWAPPGGAGEQYGRRQKSLDLDEPQYSRRQPSGDYDDPTYMYGQTKYGQVGRRTPQLLQGPQQV